MHRQMTRYRPIELRNGATAEVREVTRDDLDAILDMGARCSDESIHNRFFTVRRVPTEAEKRLIVDTDGHDRFALLAEIDDEVIAVGRWMRTETQPDPEVAFLVEDRYQGNGIGTALLVMLADAAREAGYRQLTASVLGDNRHMLRVFDESGYDVNRSLSDSVWDVTVEVDSEG